MKQTLDRLEKRKIAFEHHWLIDSKLYRLTFNYPKFYVISPFVQCIRDFGNAINYEIAHSEAGNKYLFKAFYNKTIKKGYDLQIRQHNVRHTNIIAMKDIISEKKAKKKEELLKDIADTTVPVEVSQALSLVHLAGKYIWAMSNANLDVSKELR